MSFGKFFAAIALATVASQAHAVLLNELQPNAPGGDPDPTTVELLGTPGASYTGVLVALESDGANGAVNDNGLDVETVSGTFDANGILTVSVTDFENPSFTLILADAFSGTTSSDLDVDDDGIIDAAGLALFTGIQDAVNIPDSNADFAAVSYGSDFGGTDLQYIGDEPQLIFRDRVTLEWIAVDEFGGGAVAGSAFFEDGTDSGVDYLDGFNTFGRINPTLVPEPTAVAMLMAGLAGLGCIRRR